MKIETPKGRSQVPIVNHPTILDGLFSLAESLKAEPAISMALSMRDQATQKSLSAKQHLWIYRMLRQEQPDFPGLPSQDALESYLTQRDEYLSGIGGGNIWNCSGQTPDADGTIWIAERTNFLGSKQFCLLIQYPYELSGERARLIKQIGTDHPGQPSTRYYWDRDNQVWVIQPCKDWDLNELLVEAVKSLPTFDVWGMAREIWERIQAEQSALIEQKRREDALRQELVGKTLPLAHSIYDRIIHEHGWSDLGHQREGYEFLLRNLKCLLADDMGVGKYQPLSSKILTPTGWVKMGDVKPGDFVVGKNGLPTRVTAIYPQGMKDVYEVTFSDGSKTQSGGEHLWAVQTPVQKHTGRGYKVLTLNEIMSIGLYDKNNNKRFFIPMVDPVEFQELEPLPLPPYLLGVLLGDGLLSNSNRVGYSKADVWLKHKIEDLLPPGQKLYSPNEKDWVIQAGSRGGNIVLKAIRKLGLSGKRAEGKFIPPEYKFSSFFHRLELLRGLLDTDGSCHSRNNSCIIEFGSVSYQLAVDTQFLVESMGGKATLSIKDEPRYTYKGQQLIGQPFYRLHISLPASIQPFSLPRKAEKYVPRSKYPPTRGIAEIQYIGKKECQCIAVDAPDHLYVTDHCIVTHNTIQSLTAAKAIQEAYGYPVMILAKASTTEKWKEEAGLVGLKCDVFTTHHASIPRHLESRKYVVISDETQAFKNPGSRRTKAWKDLVMHPNCIASWALSGTQVVNGDPMELWPILEMTGHPLATTQPRDKRLTPLKAYQRRYCQGGGSHLLELHQKIADDYPIMLRRTKEQVLTLPPDCRKLVEAQLTPDEQKVWNRRFGELEAEYWRRVQDGSISEIGRALVLLNNLRQAASTAKITSVLNLALALHEPEPGQHEPVAIFVEFLETGKALVSKLKELGYSAEMLDGSLNQVKRYDLNKRFQAGNLDFLVLSSGAGGVGINLTAANRSILADRPWNATDQLEDRLHRIGQTRPVCHYWVQATKVDAWIDQKLIHKLERIGLMQDGQAQTLDGIKGMGALAIDFLKEIFD